jgi:hypothetical protein
MAQLGFDARGVDPNLRPDPIPAGWYKAMMDESEMKPTKNGDGAYLACRFVILEGQYQGRKVFTNLNLRNANAQAQEIAFKQLSAIAHAVNILQVGDSSQLHNIPMQIKLKIRKDESGQYEDQNEIVNWKNVNEAVGAAPPAGGAGGAPKFGAPPPASVPPAGAGWSPPPAPVSAPPPAPVAADPMVAARADGWIAHPSAPGYHYKGQEVLPDAQVAAKYVVAAPVAPPVSSAPPAPWTPPVGGQPWQQQPPAASVAPAAPAVPPGPPHAAQSSPPPWQQPK